MKRLFIIGAILMALSAAGHSAAQTTGKSQEALKRAARDYIKHGLILATEGRPEAAVKSFEEAIKLDPQSAEAHSLLGSALAKAGNYRRAEEELRKTVELDPGYGEGYYYLGVFLEERGRKREAEEAFRRARQCAR